MDDLRYGCYAGGQLVGGPQLTREEAEVIAEDVRGDFGEELEIAVDVIVPGWNDDDSSEPLW